MSSSETRDILERARDRIAKNWTKAMWASGPDDESVSVLHQEACGWCAVGAIAKEVDYDVEDCFWHRYPKSMLQAIRLLAEKIHPTDEPVETIVEYNDRSTHQEVLELFDEVIDELS